MYYSISVFLTKKIEDYITTKVPCDNMEKMESRRLNVLKSQFYTYCVN